MPSFDTYHDMATYYANTYGSFTFVDDDPWIRQAINEIKVKYGDVVSVERKAKQLVKFGRNEAVGTTSTGYTLMELAGSEIVETYAAGNTIDSISSSDPNDTQLVTVEGHTLSGSNFTFVVQTATLTGQTRAPLSTPLARMTAIYNSGTTDFAGTIYGFENDTLSGGVPTTATKVHCVLPLIHKNQSAKASTSISSTDYWIVTSFYCSVMEKAVAFAEVEMQIRQIGGVFLGQEDIAATAGTKGVLDYRPYKIVPKNSDVRLQAVASVAGTDVSGGIIGVLAKVIG